MSWSWLFTLSYNFTRGEDGRGKVKVDAKSGVLLALFFVNMFVGSWVCFAFRLSLSVATLSPDAIKRGHPGVSIELRFDYLF